MIELTDEVRDEAKAWLDRPEPYTPEELAVAREIEARVSREPTQARRIERQRELLDGTPPGVVQAYLDLLSDSPLIEQVLRRWEIRKAIAAEKGGDA